MSPIIEKPSLLMCRMHYNNITWRTDAGRAANRGHNAIIYATERRLPEKDSAYFQTPNGIKQMMDTIQHIHNEYKIGVGVEINIRPGINTSERSTIKDIIRKYAEFTDGFIFKTDPNSELDLLREIVDQVKHDNPSIFLIAETLLMGSEFINPIIEKCGFDMYTNSYFWYATENKYANDIDKMPFYEKNDDWAIQMPNNLHKPSVSILPSDTFFGSLTSLKRAVIFAALLSHSCLLPLQFTIEHKNNNTSNSSEPADMDALIKGAFKKKKSLQVYCDKGDLNPLTKNCSNKSIAFFRKSYFTERGNSQSIFCLVNRDDTATQSFNMSDLKRVCKDTQIDYDNLIFVFPHDYEDKEVPDLSADPSASIQLKPGEVVILKHGPDDKPLVEYAPELPAKSNREEDYEKSTQIISHGIGTDLFLLMNIDGILSDKFIDDLKFNKRTTLELYREAVIKDLKKNDIGDETLTKIDTILKEQFNNITGTPTQVGPMVARKLKTLKVKINNIKSYNDQLTDIRHMISGGKIQLSKKSFSLISLLTNIRDYYSESGDFAGTIEPLDSEGISSLEIFADEEKIKDALHNLIGNSIKYTPNKGRIKVSVRKIDSEVEILVHDTGEGIRPEDIKNVFAWRKQGRNPKPGSGIGLSYVHDIVSAHGGRVWCESKHEGEVGPDNSYCSIYFTLPIDNIDKEDL